MPAQPVRIDLEAAHIFARAHAVKRVGAGGGALLTQIGESER